MEIENIITLRKMGHWKDYGLVFEWEDVFKEKLQANFFYERKIFNNRFLNDRPCISHLHLPRKYSFVFDMYTRLNNYRWNRTNIVPCIIDYYLPDDKISQFEKNYNKNPVVLISSRQVFCHLKEIGFNLPIAHLPLSLSDKYQININTRFNKEYDLVLAGRPNAVLHQYLLKYLKTHTQLRYVYNKKVNDTYIYYTSTGICLGSIDDRRSYLNLLSKSKIGFYSTPGIDEDEKRIGNAGWNQVTPRLLEYLANGCHVIARYPQNPDTEYFELDKVTLPASDYKTFEQSMDRALSNEFDVKSCAVYLGKHYTSNRVTLLNNIINSL